MPFAPAKACLAYLVGGWDEDAGEGSVQADVGPAADGVDGRVLPRLQAVAVREVVGGLPEVEDCPAQPRRGGGGGGPTFVTVGDGGEGGRAQTHDEQQNQRIGEGQQRLGLAEAAHASERQHGGRAAYAAAAILADTEISSAWAGAAASGLGTARRRAGMAAADQNDSDATRLDSRAPAEAACPVRARHAAEAP